MVNIKWWITNGWILRSSGVGTRRVCYQHGYPFHLRCNREPWKEYPLSYYMAASKQKMLPPTHGYVFLFYLVWYFLILLGCLVKTNLHVWILMTSGLITRRFIEIYFSVTFIFVLHHICILNMFCYVVSGLYNSLCKELFANILIVSLIFIE